MIKKKRFDWRGVAPLLALLLVWSLATGLGWVTPDVLASPWHVLQTLFGAELRDALIEGLKASAVRLSVGSLCGIVAGLLVGGALGFSGLLDRMFGPTLHASRQVAIFAWIPLLTAWFGNGELGKGIFIAIGAFFPVVMGTVQGIHNVPPQWREVGKVYCFGPWLLLRRIIVPAALPAIVTAIQLALLLSWTATIGAEYLMGGLAPGVGTLVMAGREQVRADIVLAGVTVIAATGYLFNKLVRAGASYALRWREAG